MTHDGYETQDEALAALRTELEEHLLDVLPKAQHKKVPDLVVTVNDLIVDLLAGVAQIEQVGAHIEVDSRQFGDLSIGLDAVGNGVSASFAGPVHIDFHPVNREE